jgi:hypothetical protein
MEELPGEQKFRVQYHSAWQQLTIGTDINENFNIAVFDALGRKLNDFSFTGGKNITIPCALSSTGVYFYAISNARGLIKNGRIMVR